MNGLDVIANLLIILITLIILDQASHLTITNAIKVSDITQLGKTAVGFSLLAFSTSLPELSVAFIAALSINPLTGESQAAISVGNVLGSNIVNISLIVGLAALIRSLRHPRTVSLIPSFAKEELGSLYFGLFVSSIIPLSLIYIAEASWFVGLILILIFIFYTYQMSKIRIPPEEGTSVSEDEKKKLKRYILFMILGVAGVVISAYACMHAYAWRFESEIAFLIRTFFFVFLGLIAMISNVWFLFLGAILSFLLLLVRFGAVALATLRSELREERPIMGVVLTRGLAAAVLATLPLQYGLLYSDVYINLAVIVIISTAVIATVGTFALRTKRGGR